MIRITKFRCNAFEELSYLVWAGKACVVIDPGFDCKEEFDALENSLKDNALKPSAILLTHAHPDHVYGVHRLCEEFGIPVYIHKNEEITLAALHTLCFNAGHSDVEDFSLRVVWIEDGDRILVSDGGVAMLKAGKGSGEILNAGEESGDGAHGAGIPESGLEFKVLFTPGHTAGGVCYLCREFRKTAAMKEDMSKKEDISPSAPHVSESLGDTEIKDSWKVLFSGDTLFAGCIGRSDLPGGDYTALMQGIFTKLLSLDGSIDVLPGHGHSTTISDERTKNPFLQPFNEPYEHE
mgnify:CR=1 FL=1